MPPSPAPQPRPWRRWCAGFVIVGLGWLASPSAVPVYDGVQTPDEPYKYVGKTPAPAAVSVTRRGGHDVKLQSSESGPQVLLDLGDGAFTTTASDLTVTASPLLPDGVPPRGAFDGNAYRISVSAPAQLLPDKAQGYLFLRAAVMTSPDPVVVHRARPQDPWVEQRTSRVGRDNLSTPFRAMGDYAVIRLPGAKPIESIAPSTSKWLRIGGIVVAALVLGALIIRSRREPTP